MLYFDSHKLSAWKIASLGKGGVSEETVVLRRWGVWQDNLVLSVGLIM